MVKKELTKEERVLGADNLKRLQVLAHGRAVSLPELLDSGLRNAFEQGAFDGTGAICARDLWDNDPGDEENLEIQNLIGMGNYHRLVDHAIALNVSNGDALRVGIFWALERGEI